MGRENFVWVDPKDMGLPPKMYNLKDLQLADKLENIVKDLNSWMMKKYDNEVEDGMVKRIRDIITELREPLPPNESTNYETETHKSHDLKNNEFNNFWGVK